MGSERADWGLKKGLAACPGLHLSLPPSSWKPGSKDRTRPPLTMAAQVPKPVHSTPENCDLLNAPGRRTGPLRPVRMKSTRKRGRSGQGEMELGICWEEGLCPARTRPRSQGQDPGNIPSCTQISAGDGRQTPGARLAPGWALTSNSQPFAGPPECRQRRHLSS